MNNSKNSQPKSGRRKALKTFVLIVTFFICASCFGQFDKLKGTWITPAQEVMLIIDTAEFNENNHLSNSQLEDKSFELFIFGDTLSFQDRYYLGADESTLIVHTYNLKVLKLTDSYIKVKPISKFSKDYFQNKVELTFKRQQFSVDGSLNFERIIFHTTDCFGEFSSYHLEVDSSRLFRLQGEVVYSYDGFHFNQHDSASEGFFTGKLTDTLYNKLIKALQTCNLTTLKLRKDPCCDTLPEGLRQNPTITIIVYFNGRRKYVKTSLRPPIIENLTWTLYDICQNNNKTKTTETFEFER